MTKENINCAIIFIGIIGSNRVHQKFGDEDARNITTACLEALSDVCVKEHGRVVKRIFDKLMCVFPDADIALEAAMRMQEVVTGKKFLKVQLSTGIGLHYGQAIQEEDGDVFGDAVNIAARMLEVARGDEIITTEETVHILSPRHRSLTRKFDRAPVKGLKGLMNIYEIIWQRFDMTSQLTIRPTDLISGKKLVLSLRWRDRHLSVDSESGVIEIGRGDETEFQVDSPLASRLHVNIRFQHGKFVIEDHSTNGTYVSMKGGTEIYLRREQHVLLGSGCISLGREKAEGENEDDLIEYDTREE